MNTPAASGMYTTEQFTRQQDGSLLAAHAILPLVLGGTRSVLDLGCGVGAWLKVCTDYGITDYHGIDGFHVDPALLQIPADHFTPSDLRQRPTLTRRYDLALCVEVAEHLPPESSDGIVDTLCQSADRVLFSAAIPGQGGPGHINEQPQSAWVARFAARGFAVQDVIRPAIWTRNDLPFWYRQNVLLYVKGGTPTDTILDVVHPELLRRRVDVTPPFISGRDGLQAVVNSVKQRLRF